MATNWTQAIRKYQAVSDSGAGAPMKYRVPVYAGNSPLHAKQPTRFLESDARGVLEALAQVQEVASKERAPLFGAYVISDDLPHGASTLPTSAHAGVQMVVVDIDHATQADVDAFDAELLKRDWLHLKYPTFSWTSDQPRYRYTFPLKQVAPGGRDYSERLWAGVNTLSGGICDGGAKDSARRSFLPSCPIGESASRPTPVIRGSRTVDPDDLSALGPQETRKYSPEELAVNDDILGAPQDDRRDRDIGLIVAGCGAVAEFAASGVVSESLWRANAGVAHFVRGGEPWYHGASSKDPRYDHRETQKKYDGYKGGPPLCATFEGYGATACATCPNRGKISTPVQLGDSLQVTAPDATAGVAQALTNRGIRAAVDQDGVVNYITTFERKGRECRDVFRSGSTAARDRILNAVTAEGGKVPSDRTIEIAEARMRVDASESGEITRVELRIAEQDGTYLHDLGPGRVARISAQGWQVSDEGGDTPPFRRGVGAAELPDPEFNQGAKEALAFGARVLGQLGCDAEQAVVAVTWMLDALRPETAKPIFEAVGAAGSGKSTLAEFVVSMIDPAEGGRRTTGQRVEDLAAVAQQQRVVTIDNASRFDKTLSDALCIASTGGTLTIRQLYAQTDVTPMNLHRSVVVTAVSPVCTAADLQTRVLRFEMHAAPGRPYRSESDMRAMMDAERPAMLGALYTLLSAALRELPKVCERTEWPHRMVSFDQLGEAMMIAAGGKPGSFLKIIGHMREQTARRTASGDGFLIRLTGALRKLSDGVKVKPVERPSLGAVTSSQQRFAIWDCGDGFVELVARPPALRDRMLALGGVAADPSMPTSDRAFLEALRRVEPLLASIGVECQEKKYGSRPMVCIKFNPSELDCE